MNYTLHQLRVFLKVAEQQSITKASEELHMTQPAVSIQLKNLQKNFPAPLVEVIGRKLYVTEFGTEIAGMAERVLAEAEAISYKTKLYEGAVSGLLRISSASTGKYVIPFYLGGFTKENPGVDLRLDVTNKTQVVESLKRNECDFAMVSVLPDNLEVYEEVLLENQLYMMGGANTKSNDLNAKNGFEGVRFVYREHGSATRAAMEKFLAASKATPRKSLELTSNEAVKQAVMAGLGYSIIPFIGAKNELENGSLHILSAPGLPLKTKWRLIWLKQKRLSPASEAFLAFLRSHKEELRVTHFESYKFHF